MSPIPSVRRTDHPLRRHSWYARAACTRLAFGRVSALPNSLSHSHPQSPTLARIPVLAIDDHVEPFGKEARRWSRQKVPAHASATRWIMRRVMPWFVVRPPRRSTLETRSRPHAERARDYRIWCAIAYIHLTPARNANARRLPSQQSSLVRTAAAFRAKSG